MNVLGNLRKYLDGNLSESALQSGIEDNCDISEYENDEQFMKEATAAAMPLIMESMLLDVDTVDLDEAVARIYTNAQDYLIGQGLIDEAAAVHINNPKLNVIHLNKAAQLKRIATILVLKMGRRDNNKNYKKYKLGQKIKKANMEELRKKYGSMAERLAKKIWARSQKSAKLTAIVEREKTKK